MEFKKCQVNGVVYGDLSKKEKEQEGMCLSSLNLIKESINRSTLFKDKKEGYHLAEFFSLLSVCHTVVCDIDPKTN